MTAPSPWQRPLQGLAAVLALTAALLGTLLLQRDPAPPPPVGAPALVAATEGASAAERAPRGAPAASDVLASSTTNERASERSTAEPSVILFGTVTTADGTPVPEGHLWLYRGEERVGSTRCVDGRYAFAGLQPGSHRLQAKLPDQLPIDREVQVEAPRTRLDLRLDPVWLLTVHAVTPDGQPLMEAVRKQAASSFFRMLTAHALSEPLAGDLPPCDMSQVTLGLGTSRGADPFGRGAQLPKQAVGVLALPPDAPVHIALLLRQSLIAQQAVAAGQAEVTFTLPVEAIVGKLATVRLRCVDGAGQAVAGARVGLSDRQTGGGGRPTAEDGRVTLSNLIPGRLGLDIGHKDFCAPRVQIDVAPGVDLDLGDIVLQPRVMVTLSSEGLGKDAHLRWWLLDPLPNASWQNGEGWITSHQGTDRTLSVFPGRYAFLVRNRDGASITEVDLHSAPAAPLRFAVGPAAPLTLRNEVGAGFAHVRVTTANGVPVHDRDWTGTWTNVVQLPPGAYTVEITDITNRTTRRTLQVARDGAELRVP